MKEYIDREAAIKAALKALEGKITAIDAIDLAEALEDVPAADAVEVVRCRNCKHKPADKKHYFTCKESEMYVIDPDEYCSYGERKEDE